LKTGKPTGTQPLPKQGYNRVPGQTREIPLFFIATNEY
jgi:hypothetical protein